MSYTGHRKGSGGGKAIMFSWAAVFNDFYEDLYTHMTNTEEPGQKKKKKKSYSFHVYFHAKIFLSVFLLGQFRKLLLKEHLFLQVLDSVGLVNISASIGLKKCDYREKLKENKG